MTHPPYGKFLGGLVILNFRSFFEKIKRSIEHKKKWTQKTSGSFSNKNKF